MALDRTVPRPDLGYLRRRPKRGETAVRAPSTSASTGSLSLALGLPASQAAGAPTVLPRPTTPVARRSPVARVTQRTILTVDSPVVTLDHRQSAIGSLSIDLVPAGTLSCVWELTDGTSGIVSEAVGGPKGITTSPMFARRPLVELRRGQVLVGLRHLAELRRLLVVSAGRPADGSPATTLLSLYSGATIESVHQVTEPCVASLAVYQVDGELVVRREGFGFPDVRQAAEAYGFAATWMPLPTAR